MRFDGRPAWQADQRGRFGSIRERPGQTTRSRIDPNPNAHVALRRRRIASVAPSLCGCLFVFFVFFVAS
ncbi:MAG: hypothetical protein DMF91_13750 [Acidobacteria bacterium]|nr:MAG: hypothetical protein DMF91_13750 [Acidobacteriota bacterium]